MTDQDIMILVILLPALLAMPAALIYCWRAG